jgi:hypothetical protein
VSDRTRDPSDPTVPLGTRAPAIMGGAWCRVERGWKWNGPDGNGGTFPRPGGDWNGRLLTPEEWAKAQGLSAIRTQEDSTSE